MPSNHPTIGLASQAGWRPMRPTDDAQLALAVKRTIWQAGRTSMHGGRRDRYLLALIRTRHPAALTTFGEAGLLAATRRTAPGACPWCAFRAITAASLEPEAAPTPALHALLGGQCARCRTHYQAQQVAERERAWTGELTAVGFPPSSARRLRTFTQAAEALTASALPPTGPRGRPARRRSTAPSYYVQRRGGGWGKGV